MGARHHGHSGGRSREVSATPPPADGGASWAKLVARAQNLEEALASERASKRLLIARTSAERAEMLAKVAKAQEEREGMEHLWREGKLLLQSRTSEWESERSTLYQQLGLLRAQLRGVGIEPPPPPPMTASANLAVALRDAPMPGDLHEAAFIAAVEMHAAAPGADELAAPTGGEAPSADSRAPSSGSQAETAAQLPPPPPPQPQPQASLEEQARSLGGELSSAKLAATVAARSASSAGGGSRAASRAASRSQTFVAAPP